MIGYLEELDNFAGIEIHWPWLGKGTASGPPMQ
jgi:hypothetical protein